MRMGVLATKTIDFLFRCSSPRIQNWHLDYSHKAQSVPRLGIDCGGFDSFDLFHGDGGAVGILAVPQAEPP